ncbi:MAG: GDP-mannose 4,6-dehydratase [Anaerolineae bacterium]|nr:GDP-mannose 4,6-dehydratase [Phycisphaerae bacterium]
MKVIITGGAGFIGCNAAARYLRRGDQVVVIDNLSRPGTDKNLQWLQTQGTVEFAKLDIADFVPVRDTIAQHRDAGLILHLAGQVAVTTSVANPRFDFLANALGTFNVLEAVRLAKIDAPFVYASTNKVYGGMEDVGVVERNGRYDYKDLRAGVPETFNLDFHSPYGCSKGAADQYVRDYARIFRLKTVVMRQSCIYGYRQFGLEDQGWVAWFVIAAQLGKPISIYGDGKQVRDVLFVEDLVDAYEAAATRIDTAAGDVFNVGGGVRNTISLLDLLEYLGKKLGKPIQFTKQDWRPGDQRCFIADTSKAQRQLGWTAKTDWQQGLDKLYDWVAANRKLFE